ncbi:MAG: hypothetical protein ACRDVK_05740, partial [Acidimicrobiia bacterium]
PAKRPRPGGVTGSSGWSRSDASPSPAGARRALDVDTSLQAITRDRTLVLRRGGLGAHRPIDQRGRLVLPPWLRRAVDLSGSVLVAARIGDSPTVVVAPSSLLDDLVDDAAGEAQ